MIARFERPEIKAQGPSVERWSAFAVASLAIVILSFWPGPRARADSVEMVGGEIVNGVVRGVADGKVALDIARGPAVPVDKLFNTILKDSAEKNKAVVTPPEKLRSIPLTDVVRIKFDPIFDRAHRTPPLIDNDQAASGRSLSGTIKLRAGYHRMVLPYWHGSGRPLLRLAYSRTEGKPNERRQRFVRGDLLAHLETGGTETPSPGLDKEGYRIPETLTGKVAPNVTYTVRRQPNGRRFESMGDMLTATSVVSNGTLARISTEPFSEENENLAMLIGGYLHVKYDGPYEFVLTSDGGSQLYVGQTPSGLRLMDTSAPTAPWTLTLVEGGSLKGTLEKWTDSKILVGVAAGRARTSLSIPSDRVTEIWSNKTPGTEQGGKADKIDRSNLPANQDVVFARSAAGRLQRVPGRVEGVQGESLVLQFSGESRKIALSKVAGVILAADRATKEEDRTFHQIVETYGGMKLACQLNSLDAGVAELHTMWGQPLTFNTDDLTGISIKNGKAVSLTELIPSRVEQVPFFDRMIPFRVNESLAGGPILLRDGKHSRGISVHAKTVLRYTIGGRFQRLRTKVGFQLPEGELGDAAVRITGDERTLFERPSLRGDGPVESLDLDLTGIGTLTLSVDFGAGQDVGDRVVWADPTLIRADVGPIADVAEQHSAK
jgi:hypothetical protein